MKRILTLASLTLILLTVACATTMSAPKGAADLSGMVTAVNGNTITVTPAGGTPTTVTLVRDTNVFWPGGVHAASSDIIKGHTVNVWLVAGSQTASRVNIGY
ncbi:MAG: hypothetical protein ACJ74H_05270 [Thermoanaerobaculia bacterium]